MQMHKLASECRFGVIAAVLAVCTLILIGCATSSKRMNDLSVGMTKAEVIKTLGQPESTSANSGVEYMVYNLSIRIARPGEALAPIPITDKYFVRLVGGKVESYGRLGDFDSTKDPTLNLNIRNQ
jgi:hypothetical protein